ncbi:hypothetical protein [Dongia sp.]|uniref:hypothetical protein n=1 Tax=Dongia sp. TaxID=1977262 RepID=UPI0035B2BAAA
MTERIPLPLEKLETLAQRNARRAIAALVAVVEDEAATHATRISAATAILQWGYGRPGGKAKPGEGGEQIVRLVWGSEE